MRQTKDCNVVASKLMFLLDDLLWVLTDSQLKAMMKYAESLSEAMEKSAQQRKSMAPEPVQVDCSGTHACCDSEKLQLSKIREEFYIGFYIFCICWLHMVCVFPLQIFFHVR